jgi:chromodomain-helicase-DNA-binding protein 7
VGISGLGINITSADLVIIYDSDWNPQNDIQAAARCHRIGRKRDVEAHRFVTSKSEKRKMCDRASIKLGLDNAVLESGKDGGSRADEMEKLLRLGAHELFEDDDEALRGSPGKTSGGARR